jgi:nucleotide-binding universal stress UspA family protein
MKRILAATDFSSRSDRALRRASLLAKATGARLILVHVVDDDQPERLWQTERREAESMLNDLVDTVRETDEIACEARVILGDPFEAITKASSELDAELIVLGPHRRQILRDVFTGTTAERTIRRSRRPVIMANAAPHRRYAHVLIATDLSERSADAARTAKSLGLLDGVSLDVPHVFDASAISQMRRASATEHQIKDYITGEEGRAREELNEFVRRIGLTPAARSLRLCEASTAQAILDTAQETRADLIVMGTQGRSGVGKLLLGSVAEAVLRRAETDVMAVPPRS